MSSVKKTTTASEASALLKERNSVALFAHTNPDGDTIGSSVALALALMQFGKNVSIFCDTRIDDKILNNFAATNLIKNVFEGKYDLMVAVDCGDIFRVGEFSGVYNSSKETLTVDHHGGVCFSKYNFVTNYASTCQMVFEIVKELRVTIDAELATYLYMGLCTDTGSFSHNNTECAAFLTAAELCKCGADVERVNRVFFKDTTLIETKLLGRAISHIRNYFDGKLVLMYLTQADMKEIGGSLDATSGIVQYAVDVDTARVGVMLTEYAPNVYKVSMRGKDFSVREICKQFGGGGHMFAAGCMINGFLEDVIEKIVRMVGLNL